MLKPFSEKSSVATVTRQGPSLERSSRMQNLSLKGALQQTRTHSKTRNVGGKERKTPCSVWIWIHDIKSSCVSLAINPSTTTAAFAGLKCDSTNSGVHRTKRQAQKQSLLLLRTKSIYFYFLGRKI